MNLFVVPMRLREANDFVEQWHRHNGRTSRDGGRFAIGATTGEALVGVAIVAAIGNRSTDSSSCDGRLPPPPLPAYNRRRARPRQP